MDTMLSIGGRGRVGSRALGFKGTQTVPAGW